MIVTITANPSVDVSMPLNSFILDQVNRIEKANKTAGGKGLNVTRVLHQQDKEVLATGFVGGDFGRFIQNDLAKQMINFNFIPIQESTRISIALLHEGKQTEVLEKGPTINDSEQQQFLVLMNELAKTTQLFTISGSLAAGLSKNFYALLLPILQKHGAKVILDSSGDSLKQAISGSAKPYLIKPNEQEIKELLGDNFTVDSVASFKSAVEQPLFSEIPWIVLSRGSQGAYAKVADSFYSVTIPTVEAISPVGSGDATIAGFASAIEEDKSIEDILKTGMTCGILNALEESTGNINIQQFEQIFSQIIVEKIY